MDPSNDSVAHAHDLWRLRWWLLGSGVAVVGASVVTLALHHRSWSWPLFVWGVALGVAGLIVVLACFRVLAHRTHLNAQQALGVTRRLIIYTACWLVIGPVIGAFSAGLDTVWIDLGATIYVAICLTAGAIALARRKRKFEPTR